MTTTLTINPGHQQFYNNAWYVGGQTLAAGNLVKAQLVDAVLPI